MRATVATLCLLREVLSEGEVEEIFVVADLETRLGEEIGEILR